MRHRSYKLISTPLQAFPAPSSLKIHLLGGFRISVGQTPIEDHQWGRRKAQALLKILALQPGHKAHRDRILDLLWPEQELESASNNLHKTIHAARRTLEPQLDSGSRSRFIELRGQQVVLCAPSQLWIDVDEFEMAAAKAVKESDFDSFETALNLYQGELLPEDLYEDWVAPRREQLASTYRRLLLRFAKLNFDGRSYERGVKLLQDLISHDQLNEEAHRQLMLLYAAMGEKNSALQQYDLCQRLLREELDTEPEAETVQIYQGIVSGKLARALNSAAPEKELKPQREARLSGANHLPLRLTSFIGRELETAEVTRLLGQTRLLTLTGIGGIGKTRLALRSASQHADHYADGVWFVDLSGIADAEFVPHAIASALNVKEEKTRGYMESLVDDLRTKHMLIVVDNCEHLLDACACLLQQLLRHCPRLSILATSREPLGIEGESVWRLNPMSTPPPQGKLTVEQLLAYESLQLFLQRVRLTQPNWQLTEANAGLVAQLCRRLEGLPLAIELATSRVKVLSLEQILTKLDDRFYLLKSAGPRDCQRHQTLKATMDWSFSLLQAEEQVLLRRLSVFAGGWGLEAAEEVTTDEQIPPGSVLDLLSRLIEKSLITVEQQGREARFHQLETVRQYSREKLVAAHEEARLGERHFEWCVRLAERSDRQFSHSDQRAWFERLDLEHDNLRAALQWSIRVAKDAERGLRLCGALWRFWQTRGYLAEGRRWLEAALALEGGASDETLATAYHGASGLASLQGDMESAQRLLEQSLVLRRRTEDFPRVAHALQRLGIMSYYTGDYPRARALHEESLEMCRRLSDSAGIARALNGLGVLDLDLGEYRQAIVRFEESLIVYRDLDHRLGIMVTLNNLGQAEQRLGNLDRAERLLDESLQLAVELGDTGWVARAQCVLGNIAINRSDFARAGRLLPEAMLTLHQQSDATVVTVLESMVCMCAAQGDFAHALKLEGAVTAYRTATKMKRPPADQAIIDTYLEAPGRGLESAQLRLAATTGAAMNLQQAIDFALQIEPLVNSHSQA
jgi:predicted ATPase/DNA-binding SARP family transcriptional activator